MRVAKVVGTVTLSRCHPSFLGATLKVVQFQSLQNLLEGTPAAEEEVVSWDQLGSSIGDLVAVSDGAEAAQPFRPQLKPVDAYTAAIVDRVE